MQRSIRKKERRLARRLALGLGVALVSVGAFGVYRHQSVSNSVMGELARVDSQMDKVHEKPRLHDVPHSHFTPWEAALRASIQEDYEKESENPGRVDRFEKVALQYFLPMSEEGTLDYDLPLSSSDTRSFVRWSSSAGEHHNCAHGLPPSDDWLAEMIEHTQPFSDAWLRLCASNREHFDELRLSKLDYAVYKFPIYTMSLDLAIARLYAHFALHDRDAFERELPNALRGLAAISGGEHGFSDYRLAMSARSLCSLVAMALEADQLGTEAMKLIAGMDVDFTQDHMADGLERATRSVAALRGLFVKAEGSFHRLHELMEIEDYQSTHPMHSPPTPEMLGLRWIDSAGVLVGLSPLYDGSADELLSYYTLTYAFATLARSWEESDDPDFYQLSLDLTNGIPHLDNDATNHDELIEPIHYALHAVRTIRNYHLAELHLARIKLAIEAKRALDDGEENAELAARLSAKLTPALVRQIAVRPDDGTLLIVHLNYEHDTYGYGNHHGAREIRLTPNSAQSE